MVAPFAVASFVTTVGRRRLGRHGPMAAVGHGLSMRLRRTVGLAYGSTSLASSVSASPVAAAYACPSATASHDVGHGRPVARRHGLAGRTPVDDASTTRRPIFGMGPCLASPATSLGPVTSPAKGLDDGVSPSVIIHAAGDDGHAAGHAAAAANVGHDVIYATLPTRSTGLLPRHGTHFEV